MAATEQSGSASHSMSLVHANGKPGVTNRSYPISVRFAKPCEMEIPIKQVKAEPVFQHRMPAMAISEIAGPDKAAVDSATGRRRTPFIDLRLNSKKWM